jgi:hypothetical protein
MLKLLIESFYNFIKSRGTDRKCSISMDIVGVNITISTKNKYTNTYKFNIVIKKDRKNITFSIESYDKNATNACMDIGYYTSEHGFLYETILVEVNNRSVHVEQFNINKKPQFEINYNILLSKLKANTYVNCVVKPNKRILLYYNSPYACSYAPLIRSILYYILTDKK